MTASVERHRLLQDECPVEAFDLGGSPSAASVTVRSPRPPRRPSAGCPANRGERVETVARGPRAGRQRATPRSSARSAMPNGAATSHASMRRECQRRQDDPPHVLGQADGGDGHRGGMFQVAAPSCRQAGCDGQRGIRELERAEGSAAVPTPRRPSIGVGADSRGIQDRSLNQMRQPQHQRCGDRRPQERALHVTRRRAAIVGANRRQVIDDAEPHHRNQRAGDDDEVTRLRPPIRRGRDGRLSHSVTPPIATR